MAHFFKKKLECNLPRFNDVLLATGTATRISYIKTYVA